MPGLAVHMHSLFCVFAVGIYANALSPLETAAVAFLGYYTVFNSYVFVLALCFRPSEGGDTPRPNQQDYGQTQELQHGSGKFGHSLDDDDEDDEEEIELRGVEIAGGIQEDDPNMI
jgi:hypothetical protein